MKKIYLCGPITGRPDYEQHFLKAEGALLNKSNLEGLQIKTVNPAQFPLKEKPWETCMRYCIRALLKCDGIALLQGWENSLGCQLELYIAGQLKIPVVYLEPPLSADDITTFYGHSIYSDIPLYFEKRLAILEISGGDERKWEDIAMLETCNRFLDPHGFEFIERDRT